jgi:methylated-DNA-[protein]-cysteine S-methyltransferase
MDFNTQVYLATMKIPLGSVSTYGAIAKYIGLPNHSRQVGKALSCNPYAPQVPCHRVIKSDGSIGGFFGSLENSKKIALLISEGVIVKSNGKVDKNCILQII